MAATLDRKRPYGEVFGDSAPHRYEQDGKYFDHEGKQIVVEDDTDTTKTDSKAPAAPQIALIKGVPLVLDDLDQQALKQIAIDLSLGLPPQLGAVKLRAAIVAASPVPSATATPTDSQVDQQLNG